MCIDLFSSSVPLISITDVINDHMKKGTDNCCVDGCLRRGQVKDAAGLCATFSHTVKYNIQSLRESIGIPAPFCLYSDCVHVGHPFI